MPLPDILLQFDRLDKNSPQFQDQLTGLLHKEEFKDCIPELRDEDVVWLVEYLDKALDSLDPSGPTSRKCLRELGSICGTWGKLPPRYLLETSLAIPSTLPVASGGSGDVYEGLLDGSRVCVRRPRIDAEESRSTKGIFHCEVVAWRRLTHPNITPLLGITLEPLQLISAWISGEKLEQYIVDDPGTDRLALLSGIADGLNYLHSRDVIHGDLRGPNIIVDDTGCPRITDFGLAMVLQNQDSIRSAQGGYTHTSQWTAPEILSGKGTYSKEADVFSFAMVMVEAFTGEVPFHDYLPAAAASAILDGKRPARPTHPSLTNKLWALMERCWNQDPLLRPEMSEVLETLRGSDLSSDVVSERAQDLSDAESDFFLDSTASRVPDLSDSETDEYPESPKPIPSGENPGAEISSPTIQDDTTGQDGGGNTQPPDTPQPPDNPQPPNSPQLPDSPRLGDNQERQSARHSLDENDASKGDVGDPHADNDDSHTPPPALPQAPANCLFREEIVDEVLDLVEQVASVALFGSIGIGKSVVALALLHHNRTHTKFGGNRHFLDCNGLSNSPEAFLERLSDAIHTNRTTDVAQLRSYVETSPPFLLVLDGVDFILDPLAPGAEDIRATIEGFGSYEHVCLLVTSRIYPDIQGFQRVEVPTLSEDGARDAFYGLCNLERSSAVDGLIAKLDCHPLSINLLANSVRENNWAWDDDQTSALEKHHRQTLKDAVEPVFRSPTIQKLGAAARSTLAEIAAFPGGVEECKLESACPGIVGIGEAVDVLCRFSLMYRQDGFVKMLSPFRFYFVMSLTPADRAEIIRWDADCCHPAKAWLPVYTEGKPESSPPHTTRRRGAPLKGKWVKKLRSLKRKLLALFGPPAVAVPAIQLTNIQGGPADPPPATSVQQTPSAPTAYIAV